MSGNSRDSEESYNSEQGLLEIGLYLAQYHVRRYQPQSSSFTGLL